MKDLDLRIIKGADSRPVRFTVKRIVNGGYVGRDTAAVEAHIEELRREGVAPPPCVPMFFPVLSHNITTDGVIEVLGSKTSGEAEFCLLLQQDRIYVGVGSDHTDRELERRSIVMSKQICPNVMSQDVWEYEEVKGVWDNLFLQSWVKREGSGEEVLYQKAALGTILSAEKIKDLVLSRMVDGQDEGLVIFSGTVPILTGEVVYGSYFRGELVDPVKQRVLTCEYTVRKLDYLKEPGLG
jgi:hypothetical protein